MPKILRLISDLRKRGEITGDEFYALMVLVGESRKNLDYLKQQFGEKMVRGIESLNGE